MIDFDNLTKTELNAYNEMLKKVQLPLSEYENIADFPPMSLRGNRAKRNLFMEKVWELWENGNELLKTQIPDNFRPYSSLEKEYSKELAECRKYIKESNGNMRIAMELYAKNNPNIKLDDDDLR